MRYDLQIEDLKKEVENLKTEVNNLKALLNKEEEKPKTKKKK